MKKFWLCIIILLNSGCYSPTLFLNNSADNSGKIHICILPLIDQTNQYPNDLQLEKQINNVILHEFKGIWLNSDPSNMKPEFKKIPNPYIITSSRDNSNITMQISVEQLYFGSINKSVLAHFLAFGLIGVAYATSDNQKVIGLISTRLIIIRTSDNDTLMVKYITGKSEKDHPEKLSRITALKTACNDISSQVIKILSLSNYSRESKKYHYKHYWQYETPPKDTGSEYY
jgi:hypothetical protein